MERNRDTDTGPSSTDEGPFVYPNATHISGVRSGLVDLEPQDVREKALTSSNLQRRLIDELEHLEPEEVREQLARWSVDDLSAAGAGLVLFHERLEETKADVLKALAKVVIALRARFRTPEGDVDWAGRSWEYRQQVGQLYAAAGVPSDSAAKIQASIRYHVGNLLRDVASPQELEAVGLRVDTPKERTNAVRAAVQAINVPVRDPSVSRYEVSLQRQVTAVVGLAESAAHSPRLDMLTPEVRSALLETVESAIVQLERLRQGLQAPHPDT
jgi:hypothetical protein